MATKASNTASRQVKKSEAIKKKEETAAAREKYRAEMVVWEAECVELQEKNIPKKEWPRKPWYPFGKKTYEQWKVEGKEKDINKGVVIEDEPLEVSWVASTSSGESDEETGNESELY